MGGGRADLDYRMGLPDGRLAACVDAGTKQIHCGGVIAATYSGSAQAKLVRAGGLCTLGDDRDTYRSRENPFNRAQEPLPAVLGFDSPQRALP